MVLQWTPYAFVRLVLCLIAGILTATHFPVLISPFPAFMVILGLMAVVALVAFMRRRHRIRTNEGWAGLLAVYLMGYLSVPLRSETLNPDHLIHHNDEIQYYTAVVTSYPGKGAKTWKQLVEIQSVYTEGGWRKACGKVLLYFDLDGYDEPFGYGAKLFVKANPYPVAGPLNPHEFDYRRFLALQQIYRQQYLRANEAFLIGNDPSGMVTRISLAARTRAVALFRRYIPGEQEQMVASALVLGARDELDDDLYNAFSATGTMHVLAVSGLHVGIIYSMIMFVLGPMKKLRGGKLCLALLSMAILWGYAMVTGLSPSVLRATMMFSFVTIAGPWGRRANIYNTLGVSAFVLLLFDPNLIFSVSFQLSYAAVFGIVYFYPGLVKIWRPSAWATRKIWEMSCVSIAAQLATFPIALFYFHQFPVYFLLANFLAIPLSFGILVVGISMLMVSVWAPLAAATGYLLYYLVLALNKSVVFTASLPFGVVDGVYITPLQCWMLIGMMFAAILLIELRKFSVIYAGILCSFVFTLDQWTREKAGGERQHMVVYHVRGHYGLEFTDGERSYFLADSSLAADPAKIAYHMGGHRIASGVRTVSGIMGKPFVRDMDGARLMCWREYTIIHIFDREFKWPQDLAVDCAIVSNNAVRELGFANAGVRISRLVVDGSNSDYITRKLEREASDYAVAFHATGKSGAYIKEI